MGSPDRTIDETLREHERFVRALSLRLLRDEHAADDNLQEVRLAALEHPPRHTRNLRGWLGVVARRLAFRSRRAAARRLVREAGVVPPEPLPPADEVAVRLEAQRLVLDAVRALPEPYRTTVGLRYLHGLTAKEIASIQDVSVESVKTRLTRALGRLRKQLDDQHGGRRATWRQALIPIALPFQQIPASAGVVSATSAGLGGVVMKKMLLASVALLTVCAGVLILGPRVWLRDPERVEETAPLQHEVANGPRLRGSPRMSEPAAATPSGGSLEIQLVTTAGGGIRGGSPVDWGSTRSLPGSDEKPYRVAEATDDATHATLRVTTSASADKAEATLVLQRTRDRITTTLREGRLPVPGRLVLDGLEPGSLVAIVRCGDLERSLHIPVAAGYVTELDVAFARSADVSGVVRHVSRGPLPRVALRLERHNGMWRDRLETRTDDGGGYAVHAVPEGTWSVHLEGGATGCSFRARGALTVAGTASILHDVVVGRVALQGTVRDARTGEPLSRVQVTLGGFGGARTTTDTEGRYRFTDVVSGRYLLRAVRSRYGVADREGVRVDPEDPQTVDLVLEPSTTLHVRLRDAAGVPITGFVTMRVASADGAEVATPFVGMLADGEGRAICLLLRAGTYDLTFEAPACKPKTLRTTLPHDEHTIEVVLEREEGGGVVSLQGVVRDAKTGAGVSGVQIRATRAHGLAKSDTSGRYVFRDLAGPVCNLLITRAGYGYTTLRDIELTPGEPVTLDVVLVPAATLHIHLEDSDGRPVTGSVMMAVRPLEGTSGTRFTWGVSPNADGLWTSQKIVPGTYTLRFDKEDVGAGTVDVVLEDGENTIRVRLE